MTSSVDGGLFYPLRQSNRYPCNQIFYARATFYSQILCQPNLYKWASFVHRIQYSPSIYDCTPNGCRRTNASRCRRASAHNTHRRVCVCCFFEFSFSPSFSITHMYTQPGQILSSVCCSKLWVQVEIVRVEEVNQWLCREAVFPIKEKADARTGLRLLTDSCKDEQ